MSTCPCPACRAASLLAILRREILDISHECIGGRCADASYDRQSRGRGERTTFSPSLRINTSSVENWYSVGSRTAWLRLVMTIFAVRGIVRPRSVFVPYTCRRQRRELERESLGLI
jgi:hypothetical protein